MQLTHHSFHFLHQIASLLNNASSVLTECMETFAQPPELKTLLDSHKDLSQLEDIGELLTITWTYSQNAILCDYMIYCTVTYSGVKNLELNFRIVLNIS